MNTLLTMNLTGSVLVVLYFIVKCFLGERLSKKYLYRLLQVNVFCFLVPLILLGEAYRGLWWDLKILFIAQYERDRFLRVTPRTPMFLQIEQKINFSLGLKGKMILIGSYIFVVLLSFTIAIIREWVDKRPIRRAIKISGISTVPELLELQKELKIRKKVDVCLCSEAAQISTIGLIHPIIFFKDPEDNASKRMILRHELNHIKGKDVLWRWIAVLMNCIHFYNPFAYILRLEIKRMQELRCDEQVISGLDIEARGKYASLLLENSKGETGSLRSTTFFGGTSPHKRLQERIEWVMKKDTKKRLSKRLAATLTAVVLGATSLTALAYDEMRWWIGEGELADAWETGKATDIDSVTAFAYTDDVSDESVADYPILYEKEYIDADGHVHAMNDVASPDALCFFHSYRNFKVLEHYHYTNGGCVVYYYDAVMCEKCSYTKSRELTATDRFDVCPHDFD